MSSTSTRPTTSQGTPVIIDETIKLLPFSTVGGKSKNKSKVKSSADQKVYRKPIVGTSVSNNRVKSVATTRSVDVFVSRLHPSTTGGELSVCVSDIEGDLNVSDINCNK